MSVNNKVKNKYTVVIRFSAETMTRVFVKLIKWGSVFKLS